MPSASPTRAATTASPTSSPTDRPAGTDWHRLNTDAALQALDTSRGGLVTAEAEARLARVGRNELIDRGAKKPLAILWEQLTAVMVLILIGAALLSLALGKMLEAGAIGAIVVLFALLGFVQEYRAEKAIAALKKLAVPSVRVVRNGVVAETPAPHIVPGDIIVLEAGSIVPADLRLIETANLRIEEAALTGESEPVDKQTDPIDRDELALGDRRNMAYSGTQISYGRGQGVAVATGMATELGRIATLLQDVAPKATPLQQRLDKVGKQLAVLGLVVALAVVAIGAAAGESFSDLVLTAISVAVAVIPEGLPAVVTVTLAIGSQRMLRRNALVRKLPAVETLGSVTVICSDKTGTLTQNRMTVTVIEATGHRIALDAIDDKPLPRPIAAALYAGVLCNDSQAYIDDQGELATLGDPTETALISAAHRAGIDAVALRRAIERVDEVPFDSERKRMSTVHAGRDFEPDGPFGFLSASPYASIVKGALDGLVPRVTQILTDDGLAPFDDAHRSRILAANDALAADGMRVLGMACRSLAAASDTHLAETDLTLIGLAGIIDPPRPEVRDAVDTCKSAGIHTVMITGDHPLTASAIARDLGIAEGPESALTGAQLDHLDDQQLKDTLDDVTVFARVSPEHKLRLVRALREKGQVVAMTGDGVNDAPALKQADIGVAMGITGTDVSKEASDMVLRDDNFATIVAAVREGRVIYDNLRRFVKFAVAGNIGKILVMLVWPIPFLFSGTGGDAVALLPLQLLWLNLMTDGLLGLSMGVEPAGRTVMQRPPHSPTASIWAGGMARQAVWVGIAIGAAALAVGYAYYEADRVEWQTMMFTSLAILQVFQALGSRSNTESLRSIGLLTNPTMLVTIGVVVALQLVVIYTPLNDFIGVEPLRAVDLLVCFALGALLLVALESEKWFRRRANPLPQ